MTEQKIELREIEADYTTGGDYNDKSEKTKSWPILDSDHASWDSKDQDQIPSTSRHASDGGGGDRRYKDFLSHKRGTSI